MSSCNSLDNSSIFLHTRPCLGFFYNRTGHRARPQVADRGALYRWLLLNTDTKLNKQSRKIFRGWPRRNNPQAKVWTTVLRAAWRQGMVFHTVSLVNQVTSKSIETLLLHAGLCRGGPNTSLATLEIFMEIERLNKSFCEELLRGESDVTEVIKIDKFQLRQYEEIIIQNIKNVRKCILFSHLKEKISPYNILISRRDYIVWIKAIYCFIIPSFD